MIALTEQDRDREKNEQKHKTIRTQEQKKMKAEKKREERKHRKDPKKSQSLAKKPKAKQTNSYNPPPPQLDLQAAWDTAFDTAAALGPSGVDALEGCVCTEDDWLLEGLGSPLEPMDRVIQRLELACTPQPET